MPRQPSPDFAESLRIPAAKSAPVVAVHAAAKIGIRVVRSPLMFSLRFSTV